MQPARLCRRCLSAALSPSNQTTQSSSRRAFTYSASKQPSRARKQETRRSVSSLDNQQRNAAELREPPPPRRNVAYPSSVAPAKQDSSRLLLQPNNLFHSFTNSPAPEIRRRAQLTRQNAYCPHPDHQQTRQPASPHDLEARKAGLMPPAHVRYECPDCGIPVSCSEEHFVSDYESHLEICDTLREINEDDHDLRSGRFFPEFEYPGPQLEEAQVNMTNWDTLLYSREFNAINDERSMRQATRLLTYPITLGSVLHELSPYSLKKGERLTSEGLKSLSGMLSGRHIVESHANEE